jgi:hypothetical protein
MKRPLALLAVWVVAAAAAVGVGFLAVSLIDASAATPAQPGLPAASSSTEAADPTTGASGEQATPGGTVYASCVDGAAQLAGAPGAGWTVESAPDQVEFRNGAQKVEVRADCSTGSPQFTVEEPSAEPGSTPVPTTPVSTTSRTTSGTTSPSATPDDHGGNRGGHGSDD